MDFEEPTVNEEEIDALGIKKKDNADVDTDLPEDDATLPPELADEDDEDSKKGVFIDDPELEEYMGQNSWDQK